MQPAEDGIAGRKRDPRDFALWKGHKDGEPETAAWPSPWGRGRPGWHLECSAMARRYLGAEFDIHGGGVDLVFPHHENEAAQSTAAGLGFARYWMHHAWLTLSGEKMSKSIGNTMTVDELTKVVRPVELRYYLVAPHYRSTIEYSEESLREAAAAYRRLEGFVLRAVERVGAAGTGSTTEPIVCAEFVEAMNDDLGTPAAIAAIHETVRGGNAALATDDDAAVRGALAGVRGMLGVLGLDPLDVRWAGAGRADSQLRGVIDALVRVALDARQSARERKDYAAADAIRDQLKRAGVIVEDTPRGPRWELS
jgi:cysteinyl-tRNA synthetase